LLVNCIRKLNIKRGQGELLNKPYDVSVKEASKKNLELCSQEAGKGRQSCFRIIISGHLWLQGKTHQGGYKRKRKPEAGGIGPKKRTEIGDISVGEKGGRDRQKK